MTMTQEEKDDLLLAIYIQLSRIYDILLVGPDIDRQAIAELHNSGKFIGPEPSMMPEEDPASET